jgi:phage-related protein
MISIPFTGSISGSTLTVTDIPSGALTVNNNIYGIGILPNTKILSFASGSGGIGTYNLTTSQTLSSRSMTANSEVNLISDYQSLSPSSIVNFYELDLTPLSGPIYRFTNEKNKKLVDPVWQGNTYTAIPIEVNGFELKGNGQFPRPTLKVSNYASLVSGLSKQYQDLVGVKFTRKRTRLKYLDIINFTRRNIINYSEQLDNSYWSTSKTMCSIIANDDGVSEKFTSTWTSGQTVCGGTNLGSISEYLTMTIEVKQGSGKYVGMCLWNNGSDVIRPQLDLDSGKTSVAYEGSAATTLPIVSSTTTNMGDGYWKWSVTVHITNYLTQTYSYRFLQIYSANITIAGNTSGMYHWVRRVQVESGTLTTPYQLTTTIHYFTSDPNTYYTDDIFYINRKLNENRVYIEWELTSALDISGIKLPRRQIIQNTCLWKYKGAQCGYSGIDVADINDNSVGSLGYNGTDSCGKRLRSCKLRFTGSNAILPYGGFPGASLSN